MGDLIHFREIAMQTFFATSSQNFGPQLMMNKLMPAM